MSSDREQQASPPERAREPAPDPPEPSVTEVTGEAGAAPRPAPRDEVPPDDDVSPDEVRERLRRRAIFLRELAEARELRRRVTPHRSRRARIHAALRRRTFRIH
ncbi:hypothetical protein [Actinomadura roseirufa]|uniref:hypothetical protein n=1 Tax=Actinomadura roseirufa TaxID=2094049 RepID=UPI00104185CF|nr:hypothetical protein [Actinomadura roseirufa]